MNKKLEEKFTPEEISRGQLDLYHQTCNAYDAGRCTITAKDCDIIDFKSCPIYKTKVLPLRKYP